MLNTSSNHCTVLCIVMADCDFYGSVNLLLLLALCAVIFIVGIILNISAIVRCSRACSTDRVAVFMMDVGVSHLLIALFSIPNISLYLIQGNITNGSEILRGTKSFLDFIANNAVSYTTCALIVATMWNTVYIKPSHNPLPLRIVTWVCVLTTSTLTFNLVKSDLYIIEDFSWGHVVWINMVYIVPSVIIFLFYATVEITKLSSEGESANCAFCVNGIMVKERTLKCVLLIGILFIISWFPLYSLEFVMTLRKKISLQEDFDIDDSSHSYIRCILFGYLNSLATPITILYAFKTKKQNDPTNEQCKM